MGILDGENRGSFRRVGLRKTKTLSAIDYEPPHPSPCRSRDHQRQIALGSVDIFRVSNLDHEFRKPRSTLRYTVSFSPAAKMR